MSRFVKRVNKTVDLGGGDSVELRPLPYGDRESIRQALLGLHANDKNQVAMAETLRLRDANLEMMLLAIVSWSGPGFCSLADHEGGETHDGECVPRPVNAENIIAMDESADDILRAITEMRKSRTPDFTNTPSPISSTAEAASTKNG